MSLSLYYATKLELKMWSSLKPGPDQNLLSKTKFNACVLATCCIEPLKHLGAAIESLVKCPVSLVFSLGSFIGKTTGLKSLCSKNVIVNLSNAQRTIGSFKLNSTQTIYNLIISVILIPAGVVEGYRRFNTYMIDGPILGFQRDLSKMNGEMSIADIYAEASKA